MVGRASRQRGTDVDSSRVQKAEQEMSSQDDVAMIAGQLADLTRTVEEMAKQLKALRERADRQQQRADSQQERTEIQQERIDLAARELTEVSDRLQAAANALRESV
jgi:molecular chaperone GrpE (heat shock protein)